MPGKNIRVLIGDLARAACAACVVGDVKIVAAGSMYATLELSQEQAHALSRSGVSWSFD